MLATLRRVVRIRPREDDAAGPGQTLFPHFPQLYDPPADVRRELQRIDPTVDLLYFGWGRWYLVRLKPNRVLIAKAYKRLAAARAMLARWETNQEWKANPGAFRRLYGRYLFWLMASQGGRPIADYSMAFIRVLGFSAILDDYRLMLHLLHRQGADPVAEIWQEKDAAAEEARGAFADPYAAKDVCDYLNKRTHAVTRYDNPEQSRGRSGFTRLATIGADGALRRHA